MNNEPSLNKLKEPKMTPTEEKAQKKAKEIFNHFKGVIWNDSLGRFHDVLDDDFSEVSKILSIDRCDSILETLNSIKGMGKIHKVKFWKLVKKYLEDE